MEQQYNHNIEDIIRYHSSYARPSNELDVDHDKEPSHIQFIPQSDHSTHSNRNLTSYLDSDPQRYLTQIRPTHGESSQADRRLVDDLWLGLRNTFRKAYDVAISSKAESISIRFVEVGTLTQLWNRDIDDE
jgi:hypothetical protein